MWCWGGTRSARLSFTPPHPPQPAGAPVFKGTLQFPTSWPAPLLQRCLAISHQVAGLISAEESCSLPPVSRLLFFKGVPQSPTSCPATHLRGNVSASDQLAGVSHLLPSFPSLKIFQLPSNCPPPHLFRNGQPSTHHLGRGLVEWHDMYGAPLYQVDLGAISPST